MDENAVVCVKCGCSVQMTQKNKSEDLIYRVISFFFPMMGLVFFAVYMRTDPEKSKACGKSAGLSIILQIIVIIIGLIIMLLSYEYKDVHFRLTF